MSQKTLQMDAVLRQYLHDHGVKEHPQLRALRIATGAIARVGHMHIAPEQAQFIAWLIRVLPCVRVLEIGTFTGYSTLAMALALPEEAHLLTCDRNPQWVAVGKPYWRAAGVAHKIHVHIGPALSTLASLEAQVLQASLPLFDLCFIDADKANYAAYVAYSWRLTRANGIVLLDNTLWSGKVADAAHQEKNTCALRALNQALYTDARWDLSMLPVGDGMTLLKKR